MEVKDEALLSYKDLARNFDLAIECVETNNDGDDLHKLGLILHVVGLCKDENFCYLAADTLGDFAVAVNEFYPLIATPYPLNKELKSTCERLYNMAKQETVKELKILKKLFCEDKQPDFEQVV